MKNKSFKILVFSIITVFIINTSITINMINHIINDYSNNLLSIDQMKDAILNKYLLIHTIFLIIIIVICLFYKKFYNIKLKEIDTYINDILNNKNTFDIRSYNEDDLSKLKNDIYKIIILLKEEKDISQNEKKNLEIVLSDISHQIKTPLTSMYVINDLLLTDNLDKLKQKDFLNKSKTQLQRIEWLITSLLKISRLDSGVIKLKNEKIKSKLLIDKSLEPLLISIELKKQTINCNIQDFNINIDLNWMSEALINIIKNAHEHTQVNGTIQIIMTDNPIYSEIIIKDNGKGIAKKDLPYIFDRFYKANTKSESIGIGLNMAKKVIELSGGEIRVSSKINIGTTFTIKLYKNII